MFSPVVLLKTPLHCLHVALVHGVHVHCYDYNNAPDLLLRDKIYLDEEKGVG